MKVLLQISRWLPAALAVGAIMSVIQQPVFSQSQASSFAGSEASSQADWSIQGNPWNPYAYYGYWSPSGYFDDFNMDAYTNNMGYDNRVPAVSPYANYFVPAPQMYVNQSFARVYPRRSVRHKTKPMTLFNQNHRPVGIVE